MKTNSETATRLMVTNWDEDTPVHINAGHGKGNRKVITRGVITSRDLGSVHRGYAESLLFDITELLRRGHEYRFVDEDGNEALRLFPCVNTDLKTVFVAAQTMGEFRNSLSDKKIRPFVAGEEVCIKTARKVVKKALKRIPSVTPDEMVECPECGTRFRVGKKLG